MQSGTFRLARTTLAATLATIGVAVAQPMLAQPTGYLVRDLENRPARLPFAHALAAPKGDVVTGLGGVWRVEDDGSLTLLRSGRVLNQLASGDLVGTSAERYLAQGPLWRTDGQEVDVLAESVGIVVHTRTYTDYVAELGSGVVFNGWLGEPTSWDEAAHWWLDGTGDAVLVGPYGGTDGDPYSPGAVCSESVSLGSGVLFCANDPWDGSGEFTTRLWFVAAPGETGWPISPSRVNFQRFVRSGELAFGRFDDGMFRTDGTPEGTHLFDAASWPGAEGGSNGMVTLADGVVWQGLSGVWFLGPDGPPREFVPTPSGYLLASTESTVFVRFGATFEAISIDGTRRVLPIARPTHAHRLGPDHIVAWSVPAAANTAPYLGFDLHVSDGFGAAKLVAAVVDHEGAVSGATGASGVVADGFVAAIVDETGDPRPYLVTPSADPVLWKDLLLGGSASSFPTHLTPHGDQLLFLATTADTGTRLWASSGSPSTTVAATQQAWEGCRTVPWRQFVVAEDWALGCARGDGSLPLYRIDHLGALTPTTVLPGGPHSRFGLLPAAAAAAEHYLLVVHDRVLYSVSRTTGEHAMLAESMEYLIDAGDRVLAVGRTPDQGWVVLGTDGTAAGTELISTEQVGSFTPAAGGVVVGTKSRLYVTQGTVASTRELGPPLQLFTMPKLSKQVCGLDFQSGHLWGLDPATGIRTQLATLDGELVWGSHGTADPDGRSTWFLTRPPVPPASSSLWRCDGTTASLVRTGLSVESVTLAPTPGDVYVLEYDYLGTQGLTRVARDGSTAQSLLSVDLPPVENPYAWRPQIAVAGRHVFFSLADAAHGRELWAVRWDEIFRDGFESGDTSAWKDDAP